MNLIDLPTNVPWLSLIWLSLVAPTLIIALLKPEQKREIRIVGAVFSFISLALTLLVYLAYDYRSPQQFQFLEEVPWLPELGINYILGVDGVSLPMLLLNGLVIFTGALISWNIEDRAREYWALLLLLAGGVYGVFVALDLFLLFIRRRNQRKGRKGRRCGGAAHSGRSHSVGVSRAGVVQRTRRRVAEQRQRTRANRQRQKI